MSPSAVSLKDVRTTWESIRSWSHRVLWMAAMVLVHGQARSHFEAPPVALNKSPCGPPPSCYGLLDTHVANVRSCYCQAIPLGGRLTQMYRAYCENHRWKLRDITADCPRIRHHCAVDPPLYPGILLQEIPDATMNYTCWSSSLGRAVGYSMLSACYHGRWTKDLLPDCLHATNSRLYYKRFPSAGNSNTNDDDDDNNNN